MVASLLALAKSIYYALSARANKIFQKQTVFVFTESQSHDQLIQKASIQNTKPFLEAAAEDTNSNSSAAFVSSSFYAQILKGQEQRECTRRLACLK